MGRDSAMAAGQGNATAFLPCSRTQKRRASLRVSCLGAELNGGAK